jgi:aspartyl-tRNA synthetase
MLALASKGGKVTASIKKLAELANVSREVATQAIQIFSSKDERSRNKDGDGKRIEILADGFRIINFDRFNEPLKKIKAQTVGTGISIDYSIVQAIKYYWFQQYKTDLPDIRIRRELNQLGSENPAYICKAFKNYISKTPAMYFSWTKFRDTWKSFLDEDKKQNAGEIFDKIVASPTGRSPHGPFWTQADVINRFGETAASAFSLIGGDNKLSRMTTNDIPFVRKQFAEYFERNR